MGLMSPTPPRKAYALGLVVAIALLSLMGVAPFVRATPAPIEPAAAMTVTLVLNQAAFLSGDVTPGDAITASYSVTSHVILRPTYDYQVDDSSFTIVLSGNTNNTTFSFRTPAPAASRTYQFLVTAREGTNTSRAQVTIAQATGVLLGATFDRASYMPGDTLHAHLAVTPRGTSTLPLQFIWTLSLGLGFGGSPMVSAITTVPEVDLSLPIPPGVGTGDLVVIATQSSTGTSIGHTLHIGTTNNLWP